MALLILKLVGALEPLPRRVGALLVRGLVAKDLVVLGAPRKVLVRLVVLLVVEHHVVLARQTLHENIVVHINVAVAEKVVKQLILIAERGRIRLQRSKKRRADHPHRHLRALQHPHNILNRIRALKPKAIVHKRNQRPRSDQRLLVVKRVRVENRPPNTLARPICARMHILKNFNHRIAALRQRSRRDIVVVILITASLPSRLQRLLALFPLLATHLLRKQTLLLTLVLMEHIVNLAQSHRLAQCARRRLELAARAIVFGLVLRHLLQLGRLPPPLALCAPHALAHLLLALCRLLLLALLALLPLLESARQTLDRRVHRRRLVRMVQQQLHILHGRRIRRIGLQERQRRVQMRAHPIKRGHPREKGVELAQILKRIRRSLVLHGPNVRSQKRQRRTRPLAHNTLALKHPRRDAVQLLREKDVRRVHIEQHLASRLAHRRLVCAQRQNPSHLRKHLRRRVFQEADAVLGQISQSAQQPLLVLPARTF
eukprot:comp22160_c0_seq1/m.52008 comp22160_c0_seq1/g.52008  ORF comp22160_c0_seq1/g.52008 comp22160_c0_seq1/m.52008 type:complete len:486 (-) comp22160_c0_seq1:419-1876(-)